jgi:hypothetical protein
MEPSMPTDPLLAALGRLRWPTPALDQPDPGPGQLWRAVWGEAACLVVTLASSPLRTTLVAAATAEQVGDDRTVIASTDRGMAPAVWAGVSGNIKTFTLENRLADLTPAGLEAVRAAAAGTGSGVWAPISDDLDDRALIRAELVDRVRALTEAEWLPAANAAGLTVGALAESAGETASTLARALGTTPGDARRLLQGRREATDAELEVLTDLLGAAPVAAVTVDDDLVTDMDTPEFRPALRLVAVRDHGGDEAMARRVVAGQVMAMAARLRGQVRRNWKVLLREALGGD